MQTVLYALYFVVVLAVLIFVHELGHFLVARWCKVRVLTFAIGFGPTMFSRTRGHTEYALKAIPLGGYVKMFGEDPEEELPESEKNETFSGKTVWQRMAIVFAGPLFNLVTAALIFCGVFLAGVPMLMATVGDVQADSPAAIAGVQVGDRITAIGNGKVTEWDDIRALVQESHGATLPVTVERGRTTLHLSITPQNTVGKNLFGEDVGMWLIGIQPQGDFETRRHNPVAAMWLGLEKTWDVTYMMALGIAKLIQGAIPASTIGGPILIAQMTGEQVDQGMLNVTLFVALLSINLGILNLLPIPVLDGGHLVFLAAEALRGRPVSDRVRDVAQQAGLFLLLALMAFAFYNDIVRIFTGDTGLEPPATVVEAPAAEPDAGRP
ncbi:MAG: RIP metalloprotease RseP [Nitrospirota bacterium]|nr:RIP metalloprotease RseP [Nitrospirota bacterium]